MIKAKLSQKAKNVRLANALDKRWNTAAVRARESQALTRYNKLIMITQKVESPQRITLMERACKLPLRMRKQQG